MIGTTLSHYRIVEELGRGGMGIVYKAEDTKLDRTVAIKVLPSAALASKDDRDRFYREAKSAAALNHPHIAQVYEIDEAVPSDAPHGTDPSPFIAMEFIDGAPLDEAVKDSPLKLEKAVALSIQIAQALEAAHDKDIVHRDIKSANVMLTAKGQAKVLDFGLAKTAHSTMLTRMGSTLGTVAYMSPEQARGEEVDHRTDLWALGVVLYELVSGKNPFGGDYEQAVVYSILNEAPEPLTAVRTGVPMQLEWIVDKCLAKDADDRYQSAKDLIVDLRKVDLASGSGTKQFSTASVASAPASQTASPQPASKPWIWAAAALVLGIVLTAGIMTATQPTPQEPQLTRVDIALPSMFFIRFPTMSPGGEYLAFQALDGDGNKGVFLRKMSTGEIQYIRESDNVGDREMGFSPDGSMFAYNAASNDGLYIVDIPAGIPNQITDFGRFAYWESEQILVMTDDRAGGGESYRVDISDPEPQRIEVQNPQLSEGYSNVLKTNVPGTMKAFGHQLVRVVAGQQDASQPSNIYAFDAKTGEVNVIANNAINPYFIPPHFLLYQIRDDDGEMVVRKLNDDLDGFDGPPLQVVERDNAYWGNYGVSPSGDLISVSGESSSRFTQRIFKVNLTDQTSLEIEGAVPGLGIAASPVVSPDGKYLALSFRGDSPNYNIHLFDLERGVGQQITFENSNHIPGFSADSRWLTWTQVDPSSASIINGTYRIPVNQSQPPALFIDGGASATFSPDGRFVAYMTGSGDRAVLSIRDLTTDQTTVLDSVSSLPRPNSFSPDSRYLVFSDSETGSSQFIVVSVNGSERYTLAGMRGYSARFTGDGQGLVIEAGRSLYYLPIRLSPSFGIRGVQELLMSAPYSQGFDVVGGDQVFVSSTAVQFAGATESNSNLTWLQHWPSYIKEELGR